MRKNTEAVYSKVFIKTWGIYAGGFKMESKVVIKFLKKSKKFGNSPGQIEKEGNTYTILIKNDGEEEITLAHELMHLYWYVMEEFIKEKIKNKER